MTKEVSRRFAVMGGVSFGVGLALPERLAHAGLPLGLLWVLRIVFESVRIVLATTSTRVVAGSAVRVVARPAVRVVAGSAARVAARPAVRMVAGSAKAAPATTARVVAGSTTTGSVAAAMTHSARLSLARQGFVVEVGAGLPFLGGVLAVSSAVAEAAKRHDTRIVWARGHDVLRELPIETVAVGQAFQSVILGYIIRDAETRIEERRFLETYFLDDDVMYSFEHLVGDLPPGAKIIEGLAIDPVSMTPHRGFQFGPPLKLVVAERDEVQLLGESP